MESCAHDIDRDYCLNVVLLIHQIANEQELKFGYTDLCWLKAVIVDTDSCQK